MKPSIMQFAGHDPRLKQHIRVAVMQALYERGLAENVKKLDHLISDNRQLLGVSTAWVSYKGIKYKHSQIQEAQPGRVPRVHVALLSKFEELVTELKEFEAERAYVLSYLSSVLNSSNNVADYLELFPESMKPIINNFAHLGHNEARLKPEQLQELRERFHDGFMKMRQRMAMNLLY